jgi:single-stranded-DNA-specific exonuclease
MHDPAEVMDFLTPNLGQLRDPRFMKGMERACSRIVEAINQKEIIGRLHRLRCGRGLFRRPDPPVPDRPRLQSPGRVHPGPNQRRLRLEHARHRRTPRPGVTLLITADCGITAHQEVDYANSLGMDVIVTDHHEVDGPVPDAYSVINPKQSDCLFSGEDLCGTGVVYHLIIALRSLLRELGMTNLPNLKGELDIVAMATVADAVSLSGLNRILS